MPEDVDTGDLAEVPEADQLDLDEPEPNEDADAPLDDLDEGEFIDLTIEVSA